MILELQEDKDLKEIQAFQVHLVEDRVQVYQVLKANQASQGQLEILA